MNKNLLHNDFLDHHENWLPGAIAETGSQQADGIEKQDGTQQEDTEIFCSRCTKSNSGNEFNGLEFNEANSHSHESPDIVRNSSVRDKSQRKNKSEQLNWKSSNEKLKMVIRELKQYLPREKMESYTKTSNLSALNYALKCVQQVQKSKSFSFWEEHGSYHTDANVYSIEELAAATSEHTPKNTDTFVAIFSLLSGKMVHVSEQAASILCCKKRLLDSSHFAELLAPQDVGIFYTHTNQSLLPLWNVKAQTASVYEYAQVKSFFCRLRVGKDQDQEKRYYPFRITPYLVNVSYQNHSEPESCCLAVAEKIHSGYEAPRIPLEKRIFTTAHTPGCSFLEIDDRAVPLLGYLPQELIGTSILMHLHPEDRPLMVAVHRKVLKFAGQPPFEHSPIRFCTQNGDYIIVDTSWSSFVNPWSRKVVFVIGRHKVRTSPLNEDVFAVRSREGNGVDKEITELQGQIYRLLLQPVHSNGSSGYGSLVSNGSYEHYVSVASSSDSNGNDVEEIQKETKAFVDINRLKNVGQQLYIESHSKRLKKRGRVSDAELPRDKQRTTSDLPYTVSSDSARDAPVVHCGDSGGTRRILSYQQINCMDSIIRYLESCNVPALKRKCKSANISSSSSDNDKPVQLIQNESQIFKDASRLSSIASPPPVVPMPEGAMKPQASTAVAAPPMTDLSLNTMALSVVSITSQCSYSSTLVHVPHPESEVTAIDEATLQSEQAEIPTAVLEEIKLLGLTKEVLSAHTQKEEQNYVDQFRQRMCLSHYRSYLQQGQVGSNQTNSHKQGDFPSKPTSPVNCKRNKQGKFKRLKQVESFNKNGNCGKRATAQKPSCATSEGSWPDPPTVIHAANPYLVPGFPVASLGGGHTWPSGETAPVLPLLVPIQPIPAFPAPYMAVLLPSLPVSTPLPQPFFHAQYPSTSNAYNPTMTPGPPSTMPSPAASEPVEPISPSTTFLSTEEEQQEACDGQPPLFSNSRSSSPLQLDLLQEEMPKPLELPSTVPAKTHVETKCDQDGEDSSNNDGHSVSSELFDLLLHEDSQSGTGSAESSSSAPGSSGSSSNETSACGAGSGNSSKYFASSNSSEVSKREKTNREEDRQGASGQPTRMQEDVLKGDLEKLAAMTKQQPQFTKGQKEELAEVHPWIRTQTIPQEINTHGCITCNSRNTSCMVAAPDEEGW